MDELMTLAQCATELEYEDTSTLRRAAKNKTLPATLMGKTWVVKRKDFEVYKVALKAKQSMDKRGWDKRGKKTKA